MVLAWRGATVQASQYSDGAVSHGSAWFYQVLQIDVEARVPALSAAVQGTLP